MTDYVTSLAVGLGVGVLYALLHVRSPARRSSRSSGCLEW
ncbi:DUF1427 family protein [Burkholderia cepacia]|nr:DUF1427 family protein [Burkholderia cepacia]